MRTIASVLEQVASVPDFAGIEVTDANSRGNFESYPLHVAAAWGDCEAIRLLVLAGARVNQRGEHGFTPLMEAVGQGNEEAVRQLISLGAEPIPNEQGQSPSEYAAIGGNERLAKFLAENGF